jgi:bacteriorhodopsin
MIIVCACLYVLGAFTWWHLINEVGGAHDTVSYLMSFFWPVTAVITIVALGHESLSKIIKKHKNVKQKTASKSRQNS